jgi:hypothetical protein
MTIFELAAKNASEREAIYQTGHSEASNARRNAEDRRLASLTLINLMRSARPKR